MDVEMETEEEAIKLCFTGDAEPDPDLLECMKYANVRSFRSVDGLEYKHDKSMWFVVEHFQGDIFDALNAANCRILGPTALKDLLRENSFSSEKSRVRPLYCRFMKGVVVCFSRFNTNFANQLASYVHHMGGSVRRTTEARVTHLISSGYGGKKYEYCVNYNVPIMSPSWILTAWDNRNKLDYNCFDVVSEHKIKLNGARVCFVGFTEEEKSHMATELVTNLGVLSNLEDPNCTHVVIDDTNDAVVVPESPPSKAKLVKAEWLWTSIQYQVCVWENDYAFTESGEPITSPTKRYYGTPSSTRTRKRKRLQRCSATINDSPYSSKRRSSLDTGLLSVSGSLLDCTATPEKQLNESIKNIGGGKQKTISARQRVVMELVQTESNYVSILETIIKLFKEELEGMLESDPANAFLSKRDLNTIFGGLPPIYSVHSQMLTDLKSLLSDWSEEASVGEVVMKYAPEMTKAYPPFINFFETTKTTLEECDAKNSRFHAFLKIKQAKPECGRQTLKELLIRPVQRLPSIGLLLNDIYKHTDPSNPDKKPLDIAMNHLKEVMTYINEDKRKMEANQFMLELYQEIEDFPVDKVSSHRSLVTRCECVELTELISPRKGDPLALFLLTDNLAICKKRYKTFNSAKKNSLRTNKQRLKKQFKYIDLLALSDIQVALNVIDGEDIQNVFGLRYRKASHEKYTEKDVEKKKEPDEPVTFVFKMTDDTNKSAFIKTLCTQMALTSCTPNPDDFREEVGVNELNIGLTNNTATLVRPSHLTKAIRCVSKTSLKVCRTLSINKTPKLQRQMSGIPLFSQTSITPDAKQLAQMRLQSCANLNELGSPPATPVPPLSVQPTRRRFSVSSLRLL